MQPTVQPLDIQFKSAYQAQLRGRVQTNGLATSFRFEYSSDISFGTSILTPSINLSINAENEVVIDIISGLIADQTYAYRVYATNIDGTTISDTKSFTTNKAEIINPEISNTSEFNIEHTRIQPIYRDFNQYTPWLIPWLYNESVIAQGLSNIFECKKKTRFFNNGFGCDYENVLFELNDDLSEDYAFSLIIEATEIYEPRAFIDINRTTFVRKIDEHYMSTNFTFGTKNSSEKLFQFSTGGK